MCPTFGSKTGDVHRGTILRAKSYYIDTDVPNDHRYHISFYYVCILVLVATILLWCIHGMPLVAIQKNYQLKIPYKSSIWETLILPYP